MRHLVPAPNAPNATESALIAAVPSVESLVGEHRSQLDVAASWGVPAHVTLLYPFAPPKSLNQNLVDTLANAITAVAAFDCRFATTRWFGTEILWLAPEPDAPFRQLTAAIWAAFPQYPPYGGAYKDVVPHLTVADDHQPDLSAKRAAERAVQQGLPLNTRIDRVLLITGAQAPQSWSVVEDFRLR